MAEFKSLPLDQILVPEDRLRTVDDNKALLIGQSAAGGELIHPITVYRTPRAKRPYTLAAGATRYRGHELNGLKEIDCIVRKLDKAGARRLEIEENLFRDDLDKLERALHVVEYRRLWEEEHGEVKSGRPAKENPANLAGFSDDSAAGTFFAQALDELGLSERAVRRSHFIAEKLTPELRDALRGTPAAHNQSQLEKLSKMEPARQRQIAQAYAGEPDIAKAIDVTEPNKAPREKRSQQEQLLDRLIDLWGRTNGKTRSAFLDHVGASVEELPARQNGGVDD